MGVTLRYLSRAPRDSLKLLCLKIQKMLTGFPSAETGSTGQIKMIKIPTNFLNAGIETAPTPEIETAEGDLPAPVNGRLSSKLPCPEDPGPDLGGINEEDRVLMEDLCKKNC